MGNSVFKSLKDKLYGRQDVRILMCGLDAAGKTTILYKLKLGEVVTTIPTIGFNVETIQHGKINFTAWDVSGRSGIRPLWRHYYQNTDALIFVVDSNDRERIDECKHEIHRFLTEDELKDAMLLIMANKQDLPNAMSIAELTDKLNLHVIRERQWYIQASCATTGDGLRDGLDWLHSQLTGKAVKKSVLKPVEETRDSVTKSQGTLASLYSSITSYFNSVNVSS